MIILAISLFVLRILIGFLALDLVWKTSTWGLFFLKIFLSVGLGLGISSLGYFLYLILFAGNKYFIYLEIALFLVLAIVRYKRGDFSLISSWNELPSIQIVILVMAIIVFATSMFGLVNYVFHRQEGDWDSWMIFNRAARFVYRDSGFWQNAFSDKLDVAFHGDYPPMLAMNIASGWEALGKESIYVPIAQSLLFSIACVLIMALALYYLKSISQAGLGTILLWGSHSFVYEGGRQTADIPLAYFMLASVVFYYLFEHERKPILMFLAGSCAGLAAWTKNEGVLFVLATSIGIVFSSIEERSLRRAYPFMAGLALPLAMTIYFKVFMAPASEFLRGNILAQLIDISRHKIILGAFSGSILGFGPDGLNFFFLLLLIYLVAQSPIEALHINQSAYIVIVLIIQFSGYYLLYLISPYDLVWHTQYSAARLVAHLYPIFIFLLLYISKTPEEMFITNS